MTRAIRYIAVWAPLTMVAMTQLLARPLPQATELPPKTEAQGVELPQSKTLASADGERPVLRTRLVPDSIAIGDRFELQLEVEMDAAQTVAFPEFGEKKIGELIEIVEESEPDTLPQDGRRQRLSKRYTLTTFEEGVISLGRIGILYVEGGRVDTLRSEDSLVLRVGTFEIDTTRQNIRDITRPLGAPLKFGEIGAYVGWSLLAAAAVLALVWFVVQRRRNRTILGKPRHTDPPHVAAIKALEIVHSQKLWQNGKHKFYYTRLTDILREYLDGRFGVSAMEMTTAQTLAALPRASIDKKNHAILEELLETSDLVKFAKYLPDAQSNESAWVNAYYFVENTKPTEVERPEEPGEAHKADDQKDARE